MAIQWDGNGNPYEILNGQRRQISPQDVWPQNDYGKDPRLAAWADAAKGARRKTNSFFKTTGKWDPVKQAWTDDTNWDTWAGIGAGALIAAPFAVGALSGLGGPAAGPGAASTSTVNGLSIVPTAATGAGTVAIPTAAATGGGVAGGLWGTGLTIADLINGGANWFDKIYSANAASSAAATNDAAMREALAFAKQQYEDQTKREQARWDATEARRVPYRQASQDVLREFRNLLGLN